MAHLPELSERGRAAVTDVAERHGVSVEAATEMLGALAAGNGGMAQFNHPEFGGSGQWMRGGMTMVSDLFNHGLKARVDAVCRDLAQLLADEPGLLRSGSFQSQSQGDGGPGQQQGQGEGVRGGDSAARAGGAASARASLFVPAPPGSAGNWWPSELGWPDSTGAQNQVRYAYFARPRRLAIDLGGRITLYDTLDHRIGGFSQQQSTGGSLSFSSQHGLIELASLPIVSEDDAPTPRAASANAAQKAPAAKSEAAEMPASAASVASGPQAAPRPAVGHDVCALIEKLADLKAKGILSNEEFASKKAELLTRV